MVILNSSKENKHTEKGLIVLEIRVLHLKADEEEGNVVFKEDDLNGSRELVGGYLELLRVDDDIDLWLNEEGKLMELNGNFNLVVQGKRVIDVVVGDVFFASHDNEGNTTSLNDEQIERIHARFINRRNMKWD